MAYAIDLPPPPELGFNPLKFPAWRKHQPQAIHTAISSPHRFTALVSPAGSGKSLSYVAVAVLTGQRTCILTHTKALQTQLTDDFAADPICLTSIKGMANFECLTMTQPMGEFEAYYRQHVEPRGKLPMCDEGPCRSGYYCSRREAGCLYFDAVEMARKSQLVVTNYSYWMHTKGKLGHFDMLVCDEAHLTPDELSKHLRITITRWEMDNLLRMPFPNDAPDRSQEDWAAWASAVKPLATEKIDWLKANGPPLSRVREVRHLQDLEEKLGQLTNLAADWVFDVDSWDGGGSWEPVWPAPYAEATLFQGVPKVILTSATIRPKTLAMLGVS